MTPLECWSAALLSDVGELVPSELQSHSLGGATTGSQVASCNVDGSGLISSCPHLEVNMGGVRVPCLVDTGSMVSTISESYFRQHL